MSTKQYIGARYVLKVYERKNDPSSAEWEEHIEYEPLTMVTYNFSSYLSKKEVPATVGNPADNPYYWAVTGSFNGQISDLQHQINVLNETLRDLISSSVNSEAVAREAADALIRASVTAEATARANADNTLNTAINAEVVARTNADAYLQTEIDEIIAPSGEAPSAAEVENARIGADGVTYNTLGNAIRTQVTNAQNSAVELYPYGLPPYNLSLFKNSDNIFSDFCNHISGGYYKSEHSSVGEPLTITETPNWKGWLIRVKPDTTYTLGACDYQLLTYNSSLIVDEKFLDLDDENPNTITTGKTACWLSLTQRIARDMSEFMIVEGDSYPANYVDGYPQWVDLPKNPNNKMAHLTLFYSATDISVEYGEGEASITIPDGSILTASGGTSVTGDTITASNASWISYDATAEEWRLTGAYPGNETYCIGFISPSRKKCFINGSYVESGLTEREFATMYSNSMASIEYVNGECDLTLPNVNILYSGGIIPVEATTIHFSNSNWLTYDIDANEYHAGYTVLNHKILILGAIQLIRQNSSYLNGINIFTKKKIAFFGDSITAGSGTTKCYHQYIHDRYGYTCLNYGYGGSGYKRSYPSTGGLHGTGNEGKGIATTSENMVTPNNVVARLAEPTVAELDGCVIFAGTNDWSNAIPMAQFKSELDATFNYYQTNFGAVPLLVVTPIHRVNDTTANSEGLILKDYVDAIIEKCIEHGVPYIDAFSMSGLQPNNAGNSTTFFVRDDTGVADGVHPNHLAHERIMRAICETLNQMVLYDVDVTR